MIEGNFDPLENEDSNKLKKMLKQMIIPNPIS